jgi:HAE1 family hydrophobic/amphiphilic exporter-1
MKLSDVSIRRPVFATMMVGALVVVGLFSYFALPVELFPDVDFPFVVVTTVYKGASAESVETQVTKKIEDVINQISGVRHITSRSQDGLSFIFIEFELTKNVDVAAQDVRDKISTIRSDLPEDIDEPVVGKQDINAQPVISLAISGRRPLRDITELAKNKIKTRLEVIDGVGSVEIIGGYDREILVALNPDKMESLDITVNDVDNAVTAANLEIPGGHIDDASREYVVRVMGRLDRSRQFNDVIVKNHNGVPVYLSDIATVSDTIAEQRSLSRFNGNTAIGMNVVRQSKANVVQMAEKVEATIKQLREELPPDIKLEVVDDNSRFIRDSIHEILFNIEFGTLLAVLVIFLFLLDFRPTIITGLSIPISIVATFTLMRALGFTINFMTLMGLSLAVGILIDDAIVVIENIYRHIEMGQSPFKAAFGGTQEIGLAVMATSFSIVAVFLPVAFMSGIVGRFFYQFGMTVSFAVLISLFVAFSLTPMLSSRMLKLNHDIDPAEAYAKSKGLRKLWLGILKVLNYWNVFFDGITPRYKKLLAASLRHRFLVILVAILTFAGALYLGKFLGTEFMTETDQGKLAVTVETPPGTTLQETSDRIAQIEKIVTKMPEVIGSYVTIGAGNNTVTQGSDLFLLTDASTRSLTAFQIMDSVRVLIKGVPGVKTSVGQGESRGSGSGKPIEISVGGEDRQEIARIVHQIQRIAYSVPGATDVDNTLQEGKPELHIVVNRKAADDLGLNLATIPQTVRNLVEGLVVSRFKEGDEEYDVRVRMADKYRNSAQEVGKMLVASTKKLPHDKTLLVPINRVAALDRASTIGEYDRYDRRNEARVNANVLTGAFAGTVAQELLAKADSTITLPPGYTMEPVGTQQIMQESFASIFSALALAIIFIYLLLASQYESFFDPFSIMLSLPLSLVGAILGLLIFHSALSIMSMIGIVMLMGLVTKNAILLIDFVKQERQKGVDRFDAILTAGPIRLRPILMTTFAMVFGMIPLALGFGPGAELRAPMARAVIGGIISSTLLTLVVVPVVYTIIDDFVGFFRRNKKPDVQEG